MTPDPLTPLTPFHTCNGVLHAESIAHVLRKVELTGDVLVEVHQLLADVGISIDDRVDDLPEETPPHGVERAVSVEDTEGLLARRVQGEPVAYAAFADNGNIRCWSSNCEAVGLKVLAEGGSEIVPLYRHPAEQIAADALKAFANEMINASFEGGSFDGGDIQDIAAKHGLLRIEPRNEECGEVCACREYGFPAECYRKTDLIASTPL